MIIYEDIKSFTIQDLQHIFLSVNWESGQYPEKVQKGLLNSSTVISAWDGDKLVGLVRGLDDGETVGFIHYLLVDPAYQGQQIGKDLMDRIMERYDKFLHVKIMPSDPKTIPFYEHYGFQVYDNYTAMERSNF